jgi:NAD(P)-dependent dehydrogenase (short-subunit alcohol dehydrogenase family)
MKSTNSASWILVTGTSSGIGRAATFTLAENGFAAEVTRVAREVGTDGKLEILSDRHSNSEKKSGRRSRTSGVVPSPGLSLIAVNLSVLCVLEQRDFRRRWLLSRRTVPDSINESTWR